jgi:hypothetical protein
VSDFFDTNYNIPQDLGLTVDANLPSGTLPGWSTGNPITVSPDTSTTTSPSILQQGLGLLGGALGSGTATLGAAQQNLANLSPGGILNDGEQFVLKLASYVGVNLVGLIILAGAVYLMFRPQIDSAATTIVEGVSDKAKSTGKAAAEVAAA